MNIIPKRPQQNDRKIEQQVKGKKLRRINRKSRTIEIPKNPEKKTEQAFIHTHVI